MATDLTNLSLEQLRARAARLQRLVTSSADTDEYCRLLARETETHEEIARRVQQATAS